MGQTILLPTQRIVLQLLKLLLTQQLLTSGQMPQVKVKMPQMDSGTLLAKDKDCLTILTQNSKILLTTVQLSSKLVTNSSLRMELFSVLNHQ
jgi:methionyl-tRNA formyltransferase